MVPVPTPRVGETGFLKVCSRVLTCRGEAECEFLFRESPLHLRRKRRFQLGEEFLEIRPISDGVLVFVRFQFRQVPVSGLGRLSDLRRGFVEAFPSILGILARSEGIGSGHSVPVIRRQYLERDQGGNGFHSLRVLLGRRPRRFAQTAREAGLSVLLSRYRLRRRGFLSSPPT